MLRYRIVDSDRSEIRNVDAMRGGMDDQRMPAEMCRRIFEDAVLVGGVLLDHGNVTNGICSINAPQNGVVIHSVDECADRQDCDNFSSIRVEHDEMFAAAGGKQSMIRGVESQSGRAFAGTKFVSLRHCLFLWIDDHEFTRIFQVLINNSSCGVGLRIFRLSAKLHVSDYLPRISVD